MKRKLIIIATVVVILILFLGLLFSTNSIYYSNTLLNNYFQENRSVLETYIEELNYDKYFDEYNDEIIGYVKEYTVPETLKKINVNKIILLDNSCVFFEISTCDGYYGGIYYSINDAYSNKCIEYGNDTEIYSLDFKENRKKILVKGEKNSGKDWYKTKKIEANWYLFEVHIA